MPGTLTPYATNVRWGPQEKTRIVIDGPVFGPPRPGCGPVRTPGRGMYHVPPATWSVSSGGSGRLAQCTGSVAVGVRRSPPILSGNAGIRLPRVAESSFIALDRTSGVSSGPRRHRSPSATGPGPQSARPGTTGRTWNASLHATRDHLPNLVGGPCSRPSPCPPRPSRPALGLPPHAHEGSHALAAGLNSATSLGACVGSRCRVPAPLPRAGDHDPVDRRRLSAVHRGLYFSRAFRPALSTHRQRTHPAPTRPSASAPIPAKVFHRLWMGLAPLHAARQARRT